MVFSYIPDYGFNYSELLAAAGPPGSTGSPLAGLSTSNSFEKVPLSLHNHTIGLPLSENAKGSEDGEEKREDDEVNASNSANHGFDQEW